MDKKSRPRYSKQTRENVVNAIVNGELWIHEAMEKYKIHDSRTVISWLRKYLREKKKTIEAKANLINGQHLSLSDLFVK